MQKRRICDAYILYLIKNNIVGNFRNEPIWCGLLYTSNIVYTKIGGDYSGMYKLIMNEKLRTYFSYARGTWKYLC